MALAAFAMCRPPETNPGPNGSKEHAGQRGANARCARCLGNNASAHMHAHAVLGSHVIRARWVHAQILLAEGSAFCRLGRGRRLHNTAVRRLTRSTESR